MRIFLLFVFLAFQFLLKGANPLQGDTSRQIGVHYEWGKLEEVIVGIGDDLSYPSYCEAVAFFYEPEHIEGMKLYGGTDARDLILVIDTNVIETAISLPFGLKVRYAIRPILLERLPGSNAKYAAMPAPSPVFNRDQIFLEGGDVMLNGYDIYVGISGNASTPEGVAWLQQYLGPKYRVQMIKLTKEFQHLDCVLSLVRPGLGVRCPDAFAGELPESIRDWEFIDVTTDEAKRLAANIIVLDDHTVIIDKQHHRIGEELKKRGETVIEIPYDKVASWGGGFRCSHHPLVRESVLD